jgi:hypothetical protein
MYIHCSSWWLLHKTAEAALLQRCCLLSYALLLPAMQLALTLALTRILGKLFSYINQPQVRCCTMLLLLHRLLAFTQQLAVFQQTQQHTCVSHR